MCQINYLPPAIIGLQDKQVFWPDILLFREGSSLFRWYFDLSRRRGSKCHLKRRDPSRKSKFPKPKYLFVREDYNWRAVGSFIERKRCGYIKETTFSFNSYSLSLVLCVWITFLLKWQKKFCGRKSYFFYILSPGKGGRKSYFYYTLSPGKAGRKS